MAKYEPWYIYTESVFENYRKNREALKLAIGDAIHGTPAHGAPVSGGSVSNPTEKKALVLTSRRIEQLRKEINAVNKTVGRFKLGNKPEQRVAYFLVSRYFLGVPATDLSPFQERQYKQQAFRYAAAIMGLIDME